MTRATRRKTKGWQGLKDNQLRDLEKNLKEKFQWTHVPRTFQLQAIKAQLQRTDVLVHAGTGSGKTMIAAGPHAMLDTSKSMVTLMISPLIALQEEQAKTFRDEFRLSAIAVNSAHEGCTDEIMAKICKGEWQIVLISPEIVCSPRFRDKVLLNPEMSSRILSVVIDEAHVVSHWGSDFRKEYGKLGNLRSLLPHKTPFVAMSATLSHHIRKDVLSKLQFGDENSFVYLDIGNDRVNVSIVVRAIHNAMNTFSDLDFIVPTTTTTKDNIPLTFVYSDKVHDGVGIEDRLNTLLPGHLRNEGLIRPYSAAFSLEYRDEVMALFKAGVVRILICTDAAGMGCNIPNIDIVVQWKLPSSVSSFVQRAGRAARNPTRTGLAVLLVEKSVYDADLSKVESGKKSDGKRTGVRESTAYPKAPKGYAAKHGSQRGAHHGKSDEIPTKAEVYLDALSKDEGLYSLVQTGICRRHILTQIYGNKPPQPTAPCCDLCDPSLLNKTRPAAPEIASRKAAVKTGALDERVKVALQEWRQQTWADDFKGSMLPPSAILRDDLLETLSSVGPIERLKDLEKVTGEDWPWFGRYGDTLLNMMHQLNIAPMQAKVQQKRVEKRAAEHLENNNEIEVKKRKPTVTVANVASTSVPRSTPVHHGDAVSQTPPTMQPAFSGMSSSFTYMPGAVYSSPFVYSSPNHMPYNPYSTMPTSAIHYPPYMAHYPQYQLPQHTYHQTPSRNPMPSSFQQPSSDGPTK